MEGEMYFRVETGLQIRPFISLPATATIVALKQKIQERTTIPVAQQTLYYLETKLNDTSTISTYPFERPVANVDLIVPQLYFAREVDITVTCPAFRLTVKVNPFFETVLKLKRQVARVWGIIDIDFQLWHLNMIMLDDVFLYKYCVQEGSDVRFTSPGEYFPSRLEGL